MPNASVRVFALLVLNNWQVKLKLFKSKVPRVKFADNVVVRAEPKVQLPPTPVNKIALASATPFVVIVELVVAANVIVDVNVLVTPVDAIVKLP